MRYLRRNLRRCQLSQPIGTYRDRRTGSGRLGLRNLRFYELHLSGRGTMEHQREQTTFGAGATFAGASPEVTVSASLGSADHWAMGGISIRPVGSDPLPTTTPMPTPSVTPPSSITPTPTPTPTATPPPTFTPTTSPSGIISQFAVIGDYGDSSSKVAEVAAMVAGRGGMVRQLASRSPQ